MGEPNEGKGDIVGEEIEVLDPEVIEQARGHLPAVVAHEAIMARGEISVDEMVAQKEKIVALMDRVMTRDVHYGIIPGVNKPSLFKPGAEAINVALRLAPDYESEKEWDGEHLTVTAKCILRHIPTGLIIASGEGMCSTMESKYRWRNQKRLCPTCGEPQIRRSKFPPKPTDSTYVEGSSEPEWYCWKKEGGCGATFTFDDARITGQEEGKVLNPDLADSWNTVLKMADKRALVAAVLNGTAASDVFTQDVEDQPVAAAAESGGPPENPRTPRRQNGPPPVPVPKSWAEIETLARACDNPDEAWPMFEAFLRATSYHLYGETDSTALSTEQKTVIAQKAAGAAVWLRERDDLTTDGPFRFYLEPVMREAFAAVLDGAKLEIPDYVPPDPHSPEVDEEAARIARETFGDEGATG